MDDPFTHLSHLQRTASSLPRLFGLYHNRAKHNRERRIFESENYSLLLRGRGTLKVAGQVWELVAPCLFRQRRGVWVDYGPQGTWWECSLVYLPTEEARLREAACLAWGDVLPLAPGSLTALREQAQTLEKQARSARARLQTADGLDARALALLLEAGNCPRAARPGGPADPLVAIRQRLEEVRLPSPALDALAREHGLSPAGFRRLWAARHPLAPGAYNLQCRIQEACRLLRTTALSLGEVAAETGFADPLYFSRRFRARVGEAPGAYRRRWAGGVSDPVSPDR